MWNYEHYGFLIFPFLVYMLNKKWYLNEDEQMLLLVNCFMTIGLLLGGWLCTLIYLLGYGYHHFVLLEIARGTSMFRRASTVGYSVWT